MQALAVHDSRLQFELATAMGQEDNASLQLLVRERDASLTEVRVCRQNAVAIRGSAALIFCFVEPIHGAGGNLVAELRVGCDSSILHVPLECLDALPKVLLVPPGSGW